MPGRRLPRGTRSRAIAMMIEGASNRAISEAVGVGQKRIGEWRHQPEVKTVVDRESMAIIEAAGLRMRQMTSAALDTLADVMAGGEDVSASARVAAAESVLKRTGWDLLLVQQLEALRQQAAPDATAQAAFNALVDSEVERRIREREVKPDVLQPGADASGVVG